MRFAHAGGWLRETERPIGEPNDGILVADTLSAGRAVTERGSLLPSVSRCWITNNEAAVRKGEDGVNTGSTDTGGYVSARMRCIVLVFSIDGYGGLSM